MSRPRRAPFVNTACFEEASEPSVQRAHMAVGGRVSSHISLLVCGRRGWPSPLTPTRKPQGLCLSAFPADKVTEKPRIIDY